jgi:arylsulfatase A-like enzyme
MITSIVKFWIARILAGAKSVRAMKTHSLFAAAILCLAAVISQLPAQDAAKPNIVLFLVDDLGWADVPWHGSPYKMPNLAALAADAVRLEAHYVHPMCSPTRAAFMTGRYASRFGVTAAQNERALPWNTVTLARALKSAGYETAITGKWHLGSKPDEGPQKYGFDHGYGSLAGGCGPLDHRYKEGPFTQTWHRNGKLIEEEGHVTDLIAREAIQWLEGRGEKPFFLYVPFTAIHVPILEAEKWQAMNGHLSDPGQRLRGACASHMDDTVGQILAVLDRKRMRDNTLVLFFGDNGAHGLSANQGGAYPGDYGQLRVGNDNLPWRGHKSGVYEGGIRVPAFAHWRGTLKAGEVHTPLHAVDWMPTLCALTGANPGTDLKWDGTNVWPAVSRQQTQMPARTLYTAAPGFRAQAVRHGDWKLVVTHGNAKKAPPATPTVELFNLATDPGETKNVASEKSEVLAQMRQRLAEVSQRDKSAVAND